MKSKNKENEFIGYPLRPDEASRLIDYYVTSLNETVDDMDLDNLKKEELLDITGDCEDIKNLVEYLGGEWFIEKKGK